MPVNAGQDITAALLNSINYRVTTPSASVVSNTTTETVIGSVTIPSTDVGLAASANGGYRLTFSMVASCTGTPTLQIQCRTASVSGTIIANFGAITLSSGASNARVWLDLDMLVTATGSSGAMDFMGTLRSTLAAGAAAFIASGTPGVSVDTTSAITVVVTAKWSAASASNVATGDAGALDRL